MQRRRAVVGSAVTGLGIALAGCVGSLGSNEPRIDGDPQFTVRSRRCGNATADRALPRWNPDAGRILAEGTIVGTDGCKTATLADVSHDRDADTLTIRVETTDATDASDGQGCQQCLTEIRYLAAIPFSGGLPRSVTVVHRGARNSETTITQNSEDEGALATESSNRRAGNAVTRESAE